MSPSVRGTFAHVSRMLVMALAGVAIASLSSCLSLAAAAFAPPATLPVPNYTTDIPAEEPLPEIVADGLSPEQVQDITVYRDAVRAVVNVTARSTYRAAFGSTGVAEAVGSGFVIDQTAHVVTNSHVIDGAQDVIITLYDGSAYPGEVIGTDSEMDLAVIRFDPLGRHLSTLSYGDSSRVQVGQRVYALGSPFGLEGTLTIGVVSGINRPVPSSSGFIMRNLIQTDASINSGNSGGPLLNSVGEVVGINVMIYSPTGGSVGIGFAIPANSASRVTESIIADGDVRRGWIQMSAITVTPRLASAVGFTVTSGVLITSVHEGGNAEDAGLRDGGGGPMVRYGLGAVPLDADIITGINGVPVASAVELLSYLEPTRPGQIVTLTVLREGRSVTVAVELSDRPQ